ncbi:MAG: DUF4296 domain-containing protein [Sediminibacterium sp.]|nr:DUF4296 domain-containing protein [Sediminibacterium sp.]
MSKYLVILCLTALVAACGDGSEMKVGKDVIPIGEMKLIIWDIMKADEYYSRLSANDTANRYHNENLRLYDQLFRSHQITKEKFYQSYKYYASHPAAFKVLIDSVDAVSRRERDLLNKSPETPRPQ